MGGTDADIALGRFHAPTDARARHAVERLRRGSSHLERDLVLLAGLWWRPSSCLGGVRWLAEPTCEGIMLVAKAITTSNDDGAVCAGIRAIRRAAWIAQRGIYAELPTNIWDVDGVQGAVGIALDRDRPLQRLAATELVMLLPNAGLEPALRRRLTDPVYTVRWLAVMALAKLGTETTCLAAALEASPPRLLAKDYYRFWDAIDALGVAGAPLRERFPVPTKWEDEK